MTARKITRRQFLGGAAAAAGGAVIVSCLGDRGAPRPPTEGPSVPETAGRLGSDVLRHLRRGYRAGRSPEILLVTEPWNVVVRWSGRGLGTDDVDRRSSHTSPWGYHQRVPIILYGPGHIRAGLRPPRSVVVADLAPTFAELMGFAFEAPDGRVLREALLGPDERNGPPGLVVLLAYDGGGWNLLERWPTAWPFLRRLAAGGTTYTNATVGSSPSVTAAIHPTMSTGAYPATHGIVDNSFRLPDGTIGDSYLGVGDPRLLETPTLADAWAEAKKGRPWKGLIAVKTWHLGMLGKGAEGSGSAKDLAVLWNREESRFYTNEDLYRLPDYLPDEGDLAREVRRLDESQGVSDRTWFGRSLDDPFLVAATPALVRHQGQLLRRIVLRERLGQRGVTDFLAIELKPTDFGGHIWNMVAPEEEHVLKAQDDVLRNLVTLLDRIVGARRYVLAMTADHGLTPLPETVGGVRIHPDRLEDRIEEFFGEGIVQKVTPTGIYLDTGRVEASRIRIEDVARFASTIRYGEVLPNDVRPGAVWRGELERPVFAAMLPGTFLDSLTDAEIGRFGRSAYPEGDLREPVPVPFPR